MSDDLDWIINEGKEPEYLIKELGPIDVVFMDGTALVNVTHNNRDGDGGEYSAYDWTINEADSCILKWIPSKTYSESITTPLKQKASVVLPEEDIGSKISTEPSVRVKDYEINSNGGVKETKGKLRWTLIPLLSLKEVVKVLEYGATKYSADNWQKVEKEKYKEALWRHWIAYQEGETYDPETGLHHVAHLVCDGLFIIWFDLKSKSNE